MLGKLLLYLDPSRRKHQAQDGIQANSIWCLETCSSVLQMFHSIYRGEQSLRLVYAPWGLSSGECAKSGSLLCCLCPSWIGWYFMWQASTNVPPWGQEGWMKQRNLQISCIAKTDKGFCYQPLFCVVPLPHLRNNWSLMTSNCFSVFNVCCSDAWPTLWILAYPDMLLLVKGIFWMYICT